MAVPCSLVTNVPSIYQVSSDSSQGVYSGQAKYNGLGGTENSRGNVIKMSWRKTNKQILNRDSSFWLQRRFFIGSLFEYLQLTYYTQIPSNSNLKYLDSELIKEC